MSKRVTDVSVTLSIAALICLVVAGGIFVAATKRFNSERIIFAMDNPPGKDYGPGTYKYPTDSIFGPRKEHFDLRRFSFSSLRNNYYFDTTFPLVSNPWGATEGFSLQMVQIYISTEPDSGRIEPFKEGANVLFDLKNPWQYFIKVVSFNKTAVYWATDFDGAEGRTDGVQVKLLSDQKTIRATIPKSLLPGDPYKWKYYVLVGSLDGSGPDNFRVVKSKVGQWNFGGGTDTDYSPNVIDILAPPGKQEKMLGSYDAAKRRQATIEPIGPSKIVPSLWDLFLDKIIEMLQKMKIKL